jgi:hypothetical protein
MSDSIAAVHVVQAFLDAYNARDIDAFIAFLADNVVHEDDSATPLHGAAAVRNHYTPLFVRDVNQKSTLLGRVTLGNYVIDKEQITGRTNEPFTLVALYRVENGKITNLRLMRE